MNGILYAVDPDGKEILKPLLGPFFITLLPAFENRADEIEIRANRANISEIVIGYKKGSQTTQLSPAASFHPFITSSRIRLISGMTIEPDKAQKGKMRVHYNKAILTIEVEIELENSLEILRLRPIWAQR